MRLTSSLLCGSLFALCASAHAVQIEQRPLTSAGSPVITSQPAQTAAAVASASRPVSAAANPAWDMFQQLEALQRTVATLQGQVEEQQQLIERLREDLRVRYTDLDQRIEQLNGKAAPAAPAASQPVAPAASVDPAAVSAGVDGSTVIAATPAAAAPAPVAVPVPTPVTEPSRVTAPVDSSNIEGQKQAYLAAYQRFRSDGPAAAITAMQGFIKQHPNSVFTPNAWYWLGEFQLANEPADYAAAEASFKRVINDYASSPKVSSSYYKLGTIADLRNQRNEARRWMTDLIAQFPESQEARLAQGYLKQNPASGTTP